MATLFAVDSTTRWRLGVGVDVARADHDVVGPRAHPPIGAAEQAVVEVPAVAPQLPR